MFKILADAVLGVVAWVIAKIPLTYTLTVPDARTIAMWFHAFNVTTADELFVDVSTL
jgi:hypothetical protein